jgi:general secretion pathway protein H
MPTSAPGSRVGAAARGFTLIELVVVLAIAALAAGVITLAIREPAQTALDQEAVRLVALLETARAESRAGGFSVVWVPAAGTDEPGFRFVGLPAALALPSRWLDGRVAARVVGGTSVVLGPDAILPPQRIVLALEDRRLEIASDGLGAFAVAEPPS